MPTTTEFTRTFGAHSTASVLVMLSTPALAAPYAAVPGVGRLPLTLETLTIDPPRSWVCITALACVDTDSGPSRLSSMILVLNFADASAAST